MTTVNGTLGIPARDIALMLGMVAKAAVPEADYLPPFANLGTSDTGRAVIRVHSICAATYRPQGSPGDRFYVEEQHLGSVLIVVAKRGESLADLASAAVDFLDTESPVPA